MNGHLDVVNRLIEDDRVDPSADDNYAVRQASRNGHTEVVELLNKNKKNLNKRKNLNNLNKQRRVNQRKVQRQRSW